MRAPKKHVAKNGRESWKVRFRSASGTEKSETFYDEDSAIEFAKLVDAWGPVRALAYLDERDKEEGDGVHALTVDDLWERWFAWKSATRPDGSPRHVRSTRTLEDYKGMYQHRVHPRFGDKAANLVSPQDVQEWIDDLGTELEAKTIADYHSLLHQMFLWGMQPSRGLVVADPCTTTDLPARQRKAPKGLRADEWRILHEAAKDVDEAAADLLLFLVATSWRWSEAARVPVYAVDHWVETATNEDGEEVEESFTFVSMNRVLRREAGNQYVVVEDAKSTAGGGRRIRVKGSAEAMILRRISGKPLDALILTTKRGAPWTYNNFHQRVWTRPANPKHDKAPKKQRILERAVELGLNRPIVGKERVTLHWLRHTGVAFLILAGEPLTSISRRVGHASVKTTADVYGRGIEDISSSGLDRMAALIDGGPPPKPLAS